MNPKFKDITAWEQAQLLMQPAFIRATSLLEILDQLSAHILAPEQLVLRFTPNHNDDNSVSRRDIPDSSGASALASLHSDG